MTAREQDTRSVKARAILMRLMAWPIMGMQLLSGIGLVAGGLEMGGTRGALVAMCGGFMFGFILTIYESWTTERLIREALDGWKDTLDVWKGAMDAARGASDISQSQWLASLSYHREEARTFNREPDA